MYWGVGVGAWGVLAVNQLRDVMKLSGRILIVLFGWYVVVFLVGLTLLLMNLMTSDFLKTEVGFKLALSCSIGASLISSALFYVRKLYKDIFAEKTASGMKESLAIEVATFMYYFSRPLFAILISIVIVLTSAAFIHATTAQDTELSIGFVLISVLASAYGAAVTGQAVRRLETLALEKIKSFGGAS